jgi:hypothetical protein
MNFFSYIRLRRVKLLRSDICFASDMRFARFGDEYILLLNQRADCRMAKSAYIYTGDKLESRF